MGIKNKAGGETGVETSGALRALRGGGVVVLAPGLARGGGACLVATLDALQETALAFLRQHARGLISVLLPGRAGGIRLFLGGDEASEALTPPGLATLLRSLVHAPEQAETLAADFGAPFVGLGHAGALSWPETDQLVHILTHRLGIPDAALVCSLFDPQGRPLLGEGVLGFAQAHGLPVIRDGVLDEVAALAGSRAQHQASSRLPTIHGEFVMHAYRSRADGAEHAVLVWGDVDGAEEVLVRMHSECLTGDVLGSLRCDCGPQLQQALARITAEPRGVLVYLRGHEGRGIGFSHKVQAYALQDQGLDTVDANVALGLPVDARSFECVADILRDLGVRSVRLLSNNPRKRLELLRTGMPVKQVLPLLIPPNQENIRYLDTKRRRMGHALPGKAAAPAAWFQHCMPESRQFPAFSVLQRSKSSL
ncbi:GTP cyclohydrolase II [Zoogloea sp.]|uniref:GTP cyclohydrolase II n=1 Tax=Zoogloea sp. TaxID=49181 RepID=UPI0035B402F5